MTRIFILGDINVDLEDLGGEHIQQSLGGTAINAALAFAAVGITPCVIGGVGNDGAGRYARDEMRAHGLDGYLIESNRPTGRCDISYTGGRSIRTANSDRSANLVQPSRLAQVLDEHADRSGDLVFIATNMLTRYSAKQSATVVKVARNMGLRLIVDLVPHSIGHALRATDLKTFLGDNSVSLFISELRTIRDVDGLPGVSDMPTITDWTSAFGLIRASCLALRFGPFGITYEEVRTSPDMTLSDKTTDYSQLPDSRRRAYGDDLTADLVRRLLL